MSVTVTESLLTCSTLYLNHISPGGEDDDSLHVPRYGVTYDYGRLEIWTMAKR